MVSRLERTAFAEWWWTVDRLLLAAVFVLARATKQMDPGGTR